DVLASRRATTPTLGARGRAAGLGLRSGMIRADGLRQHHPENRAAPACRPDRDASAMSLREPFYGREPQADASTFRSDAHERLEDRRPLVGRHARTRVLYLDPNVLPLILRPYRHFPALAIAREPNGILHKVRHDARKHAGRARRHELGGDLG